MTEAPEAIKTAVRILLRCRLRSGPFAFPVGLVDDHLRCASRALARWFPAHLLAELRTKNPTRIRAHGAIVFMELGSICLRITPML